MFSRLRASPAFVPAALSVLLMALPGSISQTGRLTLMSAMAPLQSSARSTHDLLKLLTPAPDTDPLERELAYSRGLIAHLRAQIDDLQARNSALAGTRQILPKPEYTLLTATVLLPEDTSQWTESLVVHQGSTCGVRPGLGVAWNNMFIGQVTDVSPYTCRVQLITDPAFSIRAVLVPSSTSETPAMSTREACVLKGVHQRAELRWLTADKTVENGTAIYTTADPRRAIPGGFLLGHVRSVSRGRGAFLKIDVEPAVDPSALEYVVILLPKDGP